MLHVIILISGILITLPHTNIDYILSVFKKTGECANLTFIEIMLTGH